MFDTASNVRAGIAEERPMTTGLHVVADVSCISCAVIVGWVYVRALAPAFAAPPGPSGSAPSQLLTEPSQVDGRTH